MYSYNSLKAVRTAISSKSLTCVDLVTGYLNNINEQTQLNAFLEVFADEALDRAQKIDDKFLKGTAGKLAGMVIGIKDNICYEDHQATASSKILQGYESIYSATIVNRLLAEDVIIIGRLNCDEFAMGSSNENSAYGNVLNFADNTKVPGGSSGGSAVAVQANLCLAALGSDTGGSIRQPASYCGVVGLKPTYGRVSRYGLIAYGSSFDQIGPLTNNVEDAAIIIEIIAGKDELDSTSSSVNTSEYSNLNLEKEHFKIGYIKECLEHEGIDNEVKTRTIEIIETLKKNGHQVEEVEFAYLDHLIPVYQVLSNAEASSNLGRYDGVHYGYRTESAENLEGTYIKSRTEGFGKEVKRRIMLGTFVLSEGYFDAYYTKAQQVRRLIKEKTDEILTNFDFILTPTTPTTAFEIGSKTQDPIEMYLEDIFTVQAPLAGNPAISLPLGNHSNGLPFGIQLTGRRFDEAGLLSFSKYLMDNV
ncbi:MAG: Asp-tRNA(Asn)/Glu-tRNA(Gln) amidotransferase GatCAB subunit A [Bacteroidetes bacterium]|nr:Asp-tRNA(Asn)/Glu-tRNA(Gln) amidotransferase subunit GatA [Bacteroidia bacterium]PCH67437.1 MAG: Asp-tRNA(Asn)/Glu-tRNA(Gln) amidotransferase GatCAB subunit A [Bacteroidota bacterium]